MSKTLVWQGLNFSLHNKRIQPQPFNLCFSLYIKCTFDAWSSKYLTWGYSAALLLFEWVIKELCVFHRVQELWEGKSQALCRNIDLFLRKSSAYLHNKTWSVWWTLRCEPWQLLRFQYIKPHKWREEAFLRIGCHECLSSGQEKHLV